MKRLLLLHTGGTLGMDATTGGALRPGGALEGVFRYIPEALELADIETRVLFNEDSANMQIAHWRAVAEAITGALDAYDGFVVIHGTDTMAYTAAALSFALENLPKPVILTGAQRPIGAIRTDAKTNLVNALSLATHDVPEVGIFFNHRLFRGNRAKKVSIDDFDAFSSPNYPPLAEVGLHLVLHDERVRRPAGLFHPNPTFSDKVLVLRLFPGMRPEHLAPLLDGEALGFVIEAYGAGNVPVVERSLLPFIAEATKRGKLVALCSQALAGNVDLTLYESGQRAMEAGALACADMTVEAAVVKLMYLLGRFNEDTRQVTRNFSVPLAGELTV
ncbi:MAG: L-asparaginase [Cyanobacteria bacterium RYN_339]|nr:L-asparaginase [Cyanobacteria bacterium RYN_339]